MTPNSDLKKPSSMKKAFSLEITDSAKNPLFSYSLHQSHSLLKIQQRETGFCVEMGIEKGTDLRVKRLTLQQNEQLERASIALHDVATLEIVLQALEILLTYAEHYRFFEICFVLPPHEALHLTSFEGFVESSSCVMTREGQRTLFSLFTFPQARDLILQKVSSLKVQVHYELWKSQRGDLYLRNYLQNHPKGKKLSFEQGKQQGLSQILLFPPLREKK